MVFSNERNAFFISFFPAKVFHGFFTWFKILECLTSSKLEKIKTIYFDFSAELHYLFDKKYILLQEVFFRLFFGRLLLPMKDFSMTCFYCENRILLVNQDHICLIIEHLTFSNMFAHRSSRPEVFCKKVSLKNPQN